MVAAGMLVPQREPEWVVVPVSVSEWVLLRTRQPAEHSTQACSTWSIHWFSLSATSFPPSPRIRLFWSLSTCQTTHVAPGRCSPDTSGDADLLGQW